MREDIRHQGNTGQSKAGAEVQRKQPTLKAAEHDPWEIKEHRYTYNQTRCRVNCEFSSI